jgi:hypothetical protein
MSESRNLLKILMTAGIIIAAPCFGSAIGPPDLNCNPTVSTPAVGGCTWYNFFANTDNTITNGSSFANYYVPSGDPPWTITTGASTIFRVLDGGHQGDTFQVLDNSVSLGLTSPTPIDATHACAGDPTGGNDPAACWNDPLMSRGAFLLPAGSHSLSVTWVQRVPGGTSSLQWFEIAAVPEPGSLFLVGSGLIAIARLVRRRRSRS